MKIRFDQRGTTLIELLISVGLTAIIAVVLGSVIFQFAQATEQGNGQLQALHDLQNAGYRITADGKRAETTNLIEGAGPVSTMTLAWSDGEQSNTITYSLSGTDLEREHNGTTRVVARHVSGVEFSISQGVVTVTITSAPAGRWGVSKQATYKTYLRPTG